MIRSRDSMARGQNIMLTYNRARFLRRSREEIRYNSVRSVQHCDFRVFGANCQIVVSNTIGAQGPSLQHWAQLAAFLAWISILLFRLAIC